MFEAMRAGPDCAIEPARPAQAPAAKSEAQMTERPKIAPHPLSFIDLQAQRAVIADRIGAAIARVLGHGQYIMGPEVRALEADLTKFCGARGCRAPTAPTRSRSH
jgi:hypothetical protein